jgi:hypothetical protein
VTRAVRSALVEHSPTLPQLVSELAVLVAQQPTAIAPDHLIVGTLRAAAQRAEDLAALTGALVAAAERFS